jgi:hypothetical protein
VAYDEELASRIDPDDSARLTAEPDVEVMVLRGLDRGVGYASTLPPKQPARGAG